jgi:hypothetical protein
MNAAKPRFDSLRWPKSPSNSPGKGWASMVEDPRATGAMALQRLFSAGLVRPRRPSSKLIGRVRFTPQKVGCVTCLRFDGYQRVAHSH